MLRTVAPPTRDEKHFHIERKWGVFFLFCFIFYILSRSSKFSPNSRDETVLVPRSSTAEKKKKKTRNGDMVQQNTHPWRLTRGTSSQTSRTLSIQNPKKWRMARRNINRQSMRFVVLLASALRGSIRITSVDWQQIYQNLSYNHSLSFDHPKTTLDKKIRCPNIGD